MKKRSKILIALTAAILALSLIATGYSLWGSKLSLNGNISAEGNWNIAITAGAINRISTGAFVDGVTNTATPTATVWLYDIVADYYDNSGYRYNIDDTSARQAEFNKTELEKYNGANYDTKKFAVPVSNSYYSYYVSGGSCTRVDYMFCLNELGLALGFNRSVGTYRASSDGGVQDGKVIGTAIAVTAYGTDILPNIVLSYNEAVETLKDVQAPINFPADISNDGLSATYKDVTLTLPGSWAEYSLTISNQGSANANLSQYQVAVTGADDIFSVDVPAFPDDEILKPGESCTITFVVYISEDYSENILNTDGQLNVQLLYTQDFIEPVPTVSHNHG